MKCAAKQVYRILGWNFKTSTFYVFTAMGYVLKWTI